MQGGDSLVNNTNKNNLGKPAVKTNQNEEWAWLLGSLVWLSQVAGTDLYYPST